MTKKIFAMFLAVLMVVSMLPTSVFAAGCPGADAVHTKNNCSYTQVGEPVAPTCGTQGYTNYKCNDCGKNFIADQVPAAGEHTWVDAKDEPETCEKNGKTGGKECSVCHAKVEQTDVNNLPDGPEYKCVWEDLTPNIDCMTGGTKQYQCKVCGNTKEGEKIEENTPHVWDENGGDGWKLVEGKTDLAERKCVNCGKTEQCDVYAAHDHVFVDVEEVAPKCDEAGVAAHKVCRICNVKFGPKSATDNTLVEKTDADLKIRTLHEQILDTLNCKTTTYVCNIEGCGEVIKVDAAANHKYGEWVVLTEAKCTTDGFQKRECTVEGCPNIQTEIIPALKHIERSWSVPATCSQYAYTFTYCLRAGCVDVKTSETVKVGESDVSFDLTLGYTELAEPVVGAGFVLKLYQANNDKTLYFNGEMSGYYFATTEDAAQAEKIYLEEVEVEGVEHAYRMYFLDGANKNYIAVVQNDTYFNVKFGAEYADKYWTWNADYGVLTTKVADNDYYLGTYNTFNTISASKVSYLENPANAFAAKMTVSNAAGVALLTLTPDAVAGFAPENHKWVDYKRYPATCLTTGQLIEECEYCGKKTDVQTLPLADHAYVEVKEEATCLEDGKSTKTCSVCNHKVETVLAATGHTPDKYDEGHEKEGQIIVGTTTADHLNTMYWDYYTCEVCHVQYNEHNYNLWADANTTFEDMDKAIAAHKKDKNNNDCELTFVKRVYDEKKACSVVYYDVYKCSGCEKNVQVKIATTGAHVYTANHHQDATCTVPGFDVNEKCQRCGVLKDETKDEGYRTELPVVEHDWKVLNKEERVARGWTEEYKAADCDKPNYYNYIAVCNDCGELKNDGTKKLNTFVVPTLADLCGEMVYEWYTCHCGENHIRNFVGAIEHVYTNAVEADKEALAEVEGFDGNLKVDAACTAAGYIWEKCEHCGEFNKKTLAKLPHENKDEVEFTDSCIDKVEDRHCVLCCTAKCKADKKHDCTADQKENEDGVQTCDCVIAAVVHKWDRVDTFVDSVCGSLPYSMRVCLDCGETEITNYPGYWDGETVNEKGEPVLSPIIGLNHTPVAYTTGDKAANLLYLPAVEYTYTLGADGMLRQTVKSYTGIYMAYTEPTYSTAGSASFVCSQCNEEVTIEIPAISGLGFELEVKNANGAEEITYGSLVEVIVYANSNGTAIHNFNFEVNYDNTKLVFVEADRLKDSDFNTKTTSAAKADATKYLGISGTAVNNAEGKKQNITIGEKTVLTKLYFRYIDEIAGETTISLNATKDANGNAQPVALALNSTTAVACELNNAKIKARGFMDYNNDETVWFLDVYMADAMLNGEYKYDVTIDVDKDGEITLADLFYIYDYCLNNVEMEELLFVGIEDEAEIAVLRAALKLDGYKYYCDNGFCSYGSNESFDSCPACHKTQEN